MRKFLAVFIPFISILSINLYAQESKQWTAYSADNYTLEHPVEWKIVESFTDRAEFYLASPLTSKVDSFQDNINLAIQALNNSNNTLFKFSKSSESKILQFVDNSQILSSETLGKKKKAYHRIEYIGTYPKTDGVRWVQYYFVKDDKAYLLTGWMENNQAEFYLPIMEKIMKTFRFIKQSN